MTELQAALSDLIARTDALVQAWDGGDLAETLNALRGAAGRYARGSHIQVNETEMHDARAK